MRGWCTGNTEVTETGKAEISTIPNGTKIGGWDYQDLVFHRRAELGPIPLKTKCCLASVGTWGLWLGLHSLRLRPGKGVLLGGCEGLWGNVVGLFWEDGKKSQPQKLEPTLLKSYFQQQKELLLGQPWQEQPVNRWYDSPLLTFLMYYHLLAEPNRDCLAKQKCHFHSSSCGCYMAEQ